MNSKHFKIRSKEESLRRLEANQDYLGLYEFADVMQISRQHLSVLKTREKLPKTIVMLRMGPIWTKAAVKEFIESL